MPRRSCFLDRGCCNKDCIAFVDGDEDAAKPWSVCLPLRSLDTVATSVKRVTDRIDVALKDLLRHKQSQVPTGIK